MCCPTPSAATWLVSCECVPLHWSRARSSVSTKLPHVSASSLFDGAEVTAVDACRVGDRRHLVRRAGSGRGGSGERVDRGVQDVRGGARAVAGGGHEDHPRSG